MDRHLKTPLKKAGFLAAALLIVCAAQAQTQTQTQTQAQAQAPAQTPGTTTDSTHHRYSMHHRWNKEQNDWNSGQHGYAHRDHQKGNPIHYTPEQRHQLMAINKEYHQKADDLFNQDNLTLKQYKAGLLALQKDRKDKKAALLTPQQKDELATRRKRMDENRQVAQAARLERLKLNLNLTDDQVAKLKAGQDDLHNQAKAIHENNDLLPQQKREQMKALLAKRNDTYKTVLTPEQFSQFEKMHDRGFGPGRDGFGRPERPDSRDREI